MLGSCFESAMYSIIFPLTFPIVFIGSVLIGTLRLTNKLDKEYEEKQKRVENEREKRLKKIIIIK